MRLMRSTIGGAIVGSAVVLASAAPAWAAGPALRWQSPKTVTSGQAFQVSSIDPCPPLPNPGDQLLVGVDVTFPGGAMGNVLSANPDRSWSGQLTFTFSNAPDHARISADCEDFNGVSATSYAQYHFRPVKLVSS